MLQRRSKVISSPQIFTIVSRSRSPSQVNRSRVHSEGGSEDASGKEESDCENLEGPRFALERSCIHCALVAEYRLVCPFKKFSFPLQTPVLLILSPRPRRNRQVFSLSSSGGWRQSEQMKTNRLTPSPGD